jgi:hypothetical protein
MLGCWFIALRSSYIDDVLSLSNSKFGDFVDRIYPIEIQDTTDTDMTYTSKLTASGG